MNCNVDSDSNTYNFTFGMNRSGVIQDDKTNKYNEHRFVGDPPE